MSRLSQLESLTVSIPCRRLPPEEPTGDYGLTQDIRCAIRIFKHVSRKYLRDVRMEFELDPLASLGTRLYWGGAPTLEACRALQEAVLTFPLHRIILRHNPIHAGRAGRAEFWSPTIKHAFQIVAERGLLTSVHSKPFVESVYATSD